MDRELWPPILILTLPGLKSGSMAQRVRGTREILRRGWRALNIQKPFVSACNKTRQHVLDTKMGGLHFFGLLSDFTRLPSSWHFTMTPPELRIFSSFCVEQSSRQVLQMLLDRPQGSLQLVRGLDEQLHRGVGLLNPVGRPPAPPPGCHSPASAPAHCLPWPLPGCHRWPWQPPGH
jgi:hypothetical protein